jgi:predicted extracellular nuclease
MQHRGLTAPSLLVLTLASGLACNNLTPATTESTTDGPGTGSTGTDGTGTDTGSTSESTPTTTDAPTGSEPTGNPTTDSTTNPTDPTTGGGEDVTIFDVQMGKFAEDSVVTIKGVIVTSPTKIKDNKGTLFVEEPEGGEYSGISVFMYDEVTAALDAPPGSVVDITATYQEFFGFSQLVVMAVGDITVTGTDTIPAPAVVEAVDIATNGAKAENYEGVLVQINDATVTMPGVDVGQFEVEGGARVSDYFLFDLGQSPKPAAGDTYPSIVGPLLYSFDQFQIAPRSLADLGEGEDTTTGDTDTTTGGEGDTVYDLQMGKFTINDPVTLEGVIVTSGLTFKKDGFFVQDPMGGEFSGVFVYINKNMVTVAPGDVLTIKGTYDEFFDYTELKVAAAADITKTGTAPVPAPELVAAADIATGGPKAEAYEGVLVMVENVEVSAPVDMNGEFIVDTKLRVDDLFFAKADWVAPAIGDTYQSIVGPLSYSFNEFKLAPRTAADIME